MERLTPFLNVFALILLASNTVAAGRHLSEHRSSRTTPGPTTPTATDIQPDRLPDLYYFILDAYTGFEGIHERHGYDNSAFATRMQDRGFHVATGSRVAYDLSEDSTASTLNMRSLEKNEDAYAALRNNLAVQTLKRYGYVVYQTPVDEFGIFDLADHVLTYTKEHQTSVVNDFLLLVLQRSMLAPLYERLIQSNDYGRYHRTAIRFDLDNATKYVRAPGPKFVYFHMHCPHWPFVYDENGGAVDFEDYFNIDDPDIYLGQVKFITIEIEKVIDTILEQATRPTAIIVQSDHGQRDYAPLNQGYVKDIGDTWSNVLNAFVFPDRSIDAPLDISPIETLELFFESYGMETTQPTAAATQHKP